jgi:polysaccharide pyruvyl transferase WcaK-like protein
LNAPHTPTTVALLGVTRNTDNFGVRVLLTSAVEALTTIEPGANIVLLDYGRSPESWDEHISSGVAPVRLVNLRFSWRIHLPNNIVRLLLIALLLRAVPGRLLRDRVIARNPWLAEICELRTCYSLSGGDSFSDIYGFERFIYVALPQLLALLLGRPLVMLPQTYGPFSGRICRALARRILSSAQGIYSRDEAGAAAVGELTSRPKSIVNVVPDLGFGMSAAPIGSSANAVLDLLARKRPLVGVNASRLLYIGGYSGENMFGLREPFPALVEAMIEMIVKELGASVLLVPHVVGGPESQEDETVLCKHLKASLGPQLGGHVHYLDETLSHQQMKTVIGKCDVFVGARMHACIGAVSQGVPTVCLAYSSKFEGVMKPLGLGVRVVDLRVQSQHEILRAVAEAFRDRERLRCALASESSRVKDLALSLKSGANARGQA